MQMVVKICLCCEKPVDTCHFQRTLKELGADKFGECLVVEKEIPAEI